MKKLTMLMASLTVTLSTLFLGVACVNNPPSSSEDSGSGVVLTLSETQKTLDRYEKFTLIADKANVTWSSDNANVATVTGGVVQAKGVGTATITATSGDLTATCVVTVEDTGALPILQVSDDTLSLVMGDTYELRSSVVYKKAEQSDAVITYTSSDNTIATVSQNGTVAALAYGNVTLTVTAEWNGVDSSFLQETVEVAVKENVIVSLDEYEATVYTNNVTVDEQEFSMTTTLNGTVLIGGSSDNVEQSRISWESDNEAVATVAGGVVTAVKEGTANIKMKYQTEIGTYYSPALKLTVAFPTVDKTESVLVDIDGTRTTLGEQLSGNKIFGADKTITKITSQDDEETDILSDTAWINEHDIGDETARTSILTVYNAEYAYRVKALVVTKIISTYEDLTKLQEYAGVTQQAVSAGNYSCTYYNYNGYFVLANDIIVKDSDGVINTKSAGALDTAGLFVKTNGFSGTFDGRGHSILNAKFGAGGLLGDISKDGVVKNLAIVDAKITEEDGANKGAGVLSYSFSGKAENIFVSYTTLKARSGVFGRATNGGSVKNMVVYYDKDGGYSGGAIAGWNLSALTVDNVYVVYARGMAVADAILTGNGKPQYSSTVTEIKEENLSTATFENLDESLWLVQDGRLPLFKSTIDEFYMSVTGEVEVEEGKAVTLTAGLKDIAGNFVSFYPVTWTSSNEAVATVDNGVLTILTKGTTTITATCGAFTKTCTITIVEPSIIPQDKTNVTLYIDANNTASLSAQLLTAATQENLFTSFTPTKIVDFADALSTDLLGNTNYLKTVDTDGTAREKILVVYGDTFAYKVKVMIVTKVITTATELDSLQSYSTVTTGQVQIKTDGTKTTYYSYGGYFVLGGNITATGTEAAISSNTIGPVDTATYITGEMGFHGTFDGRGYTVDGFKYGVGGIFGDLGNGAVIKNVAFTNCAVGAASGDKGIAILSSNAKGTWTVENVYAQGTLNGNNVGMLMGRSAGGGSISNVVIKMKEVSGWTNGAFTCIMPTVIDTAFNNVAVVYDKDCRLAQSKVYGSSGKLINGVSEYVEQTDGTIKEITAKTVKSGNELSGVTTSETAATAADFANFDSKYWTVSAGYAPTFKSIANA